MPLVHAVPPASAPPASWVRICARARIARVFTVPSGMPRRRAASFVLSPSSTVAWMTARNSGDSETSAAPTSPYSTDKQAASSAAGIAPGVDLGEQHLRGDLAAAKPRDQPADPDAPQPGADLAVASEPPGPLPDGDEGVLQHVRDQLRVVAAPPQPDRQPRRVALVEDPQRPGVTVGDGGQQPPVVALIGGHERIVAARGSSGSLSGDQVS